MSTDAGTSWAPAVAAYGLAGARLDLPRGPLSDDEWRRLIEEVQGQHVPGLLVRAAEDAAFPVTPEQRQEARDAHRSSMWVALALERTLLGAAQVLTAHEVDHRVLKGPALAHLAYPEPADRSFADVDLLVPSHSFDAAVAALATAGVHRRSAQLRPDFDRRFAKGVTLITPDGYEIDLHRTFAAGPFGMWVDLDELFTTSSAFGLAGVPLLGLGPEERFLHACYHAAIGDAVPRLVSVRDVAQLLLRTELDLGRVSQLARTWKAEAVVARAVSLAWATFQLVDDVPLSAWALSYRANPTEVRALNVYVGEGRRYTDKAVAGLWAVPGLRSKASYARALLVPDRSARPGPPERARRLLRAATAVGRLRLRA